jgi:hypothetical protein
MGPGYTVAPFPTLGASRTETIPLPTTLSDTALSLKREHEIGDTL